MESVIKWHTGKPKETGEYLVTALNGEVDYDVFYKCSDGNCFWGFYDNVLAWYKLSDIKPYKEKEL